MIAGKNHFKFEHKKNLMSRFIDTFLRKDTNPEPIKVTIYDNYNPSISSASGDNRKEEAKSKFTKVLMSATSLKLLKRAHNYVILDSNENPDFLNSLLSYLKDMGLSPKQPSYISKANTKVRNKAELLIANYFFDIGLKGFIYEPIIVFFNRKGKPFFKIADFYLPQLDLIHEHFGYTSNPAYVEGMNKKKSIYDNYNLKWFHTNSMDETNLDRVLTLKLNKLIKN